MARASQLPIPSIKPIAWFHAYILCGIIGIRWGRCVPGYANCNEKLNNILGEYLKYACGDDEWTKGRILEAMRHKTVTAIKTDARVAFPSIFPRNRKAHRLRVPDELSDIEQVSFNPTRIKQWQKRVKTIKKEIAMNENAVVQEVTETSQPSVNSSVKTTSNERVTVNFFIPTGVSISSLTLENYRELTGKRFRMTKDQSKVRGLNREEAFAESKALAFSQLGAVGGA